MPTLKALDDQRRVVYLGSFAEDRSLPGARVGYVVADQPVRGADGTVRPARRRAVEDQEHADREHPPLAQAVVGGKLLEHGCSLVRANEREREVYAANRPGWSTGLAARFAGPRSPVSWNVPAGGFFVVVTVPFTVDDALLDRSARDYGVLWTADAPLLRHGRRGRDACGPCACRAAP